MLVALLVVGGGESCNSCRVLGAHAYSCAGRRLLNSIVMPVSLCQPRVAQARGSYACLHADAYNSVKEALEQEEGLTFFKDAVTALGWFDDPPPTRAPAPFNSLLPFHPEDLDGATLLVPTDEVRPPHLHLYLHIPASHIQTLCLHSQRDALEGPNL